MALTRKWLRETLATAGVEEGRITDVVNSIIAGHTDSIDALTEERDAANAKAANAENAAQALETANARIAELEKRPTADDLEAAKASAQKALDDYKASVTAESAKRAKLTALMNALKEAGANEQAAKLMASGCDLAKLELDGDALRDAQKAVESFKAEYGDLFGQEQEKGVPPTQPPTGANNSPDTMTDDQYFAMKHKKG